MVFLYFLLYAVFKEHRKASLPRSEIVPWTRKGPEVLSKLNRIRIVQPKRWWKASMLKAWGRSVSRRINFWSTP